MNTVRRIALFTLALTLVGHLCTASAQAPRFLNPVNYDLPGTLTVTVADINGDGAPDIITANGFTGGQGVSLLFNNGDGSFKPARSIVATGSPTFVAVADFNGDGKADLAVANGPNTTTVTLLLGNGDGTFQLPIELFTGEAESIAVADFNGDGKPDLAVSGTNTGEVVLLNKGAGNFTVSYTVAFNPAILPKITAGDFNGDGKQDFLIAGGSYDLQLGNGDGTFRDGLLQSLPPVLYTVVGDWNGDKRLDIATAALGSRGTIVPEMGFGNADGTFADSFITNFYAKSDNAVAADFDLDGKLDIFSAEGLSLGHGDGTFQRVGAGFGLRPGFPSYSATGDLDRNGSPDLVMATGTGVLVALNTAGHPPLLAQITTSSTFPLGGTQLTGTVTLGGPAPAGGAIVALSSNNPVAFFPNGNTVTIPAGLASATFPIATKIVIAPSAVTLTASYHATQLAANFTIVPSFNLVSVSVAPARIIGMFGGDAAVGTVTLSGLASDNVVVQLTSANPAALTVPATVLVPPGSMSATFPATALHVPADTSVLVSATYAGVKRTGTVTVLKETPTVTITKAEYVVKKSQLNIEANSTDRVASLQIYNANTGVLVGSIPLVNVGKFVGQLQVTGTFTSAAAQSSVGGLSIAVVQQK